MTNLPENSAREGASDPELGPDEIHCRRCQAPGPQLARPPLPKERGLLIQSSICQVCWGEWLKHQTALINHYGLDPRDPESRAFLYTQVDQVLLGDGEGEKVDTTQEGMIQW